MRANNTNNQGTWTRFYSNGMLNYKAVTWLTTFVTPQVVTVRNQVQVSYCFDSVFCFTSVIIAYFGYLLYYLQEC